MLAEKTASEVRPRPSGAEGVKEREYHDRKGYLEDQPEVSSLDDARFVPGADKAEQECTQHPTSNEQQACPSNQAEGVRQREDIMGHEAKKKREASTGKHGKHPKHKAKDDCSPEDTSRP